MHSSECSLILEKSMWFIVEWITDIKERSMYMTEYGNWISRQYCKIQLKNK